MNGVRFVTLLVQVVVNVIGGHYAYVAIFDHAAWWKGLVGAVMLFAAMVIGYADASTKPAR